MIYFDKDEMIFNGERFFLQECKAGHYCVPICKKRNLVTDMENGNQQSTVVLTVTEERSFWVTMMKR